ncbi:MAG TPA: DUF4214 domain-containing protein, partial [Sumerlaeia bacterium]|nr:DUF4214 domain-containing protein [Sumerlaeia bacterium]
HDPTSEDYVARFYRAFLGRFPNDAEIVYWMGELDSGSRSPGDLIDLFADSEEFSRILDAYFLPIPSALTPTATPVATAGP